MALHLDHELPPWGPPSVHPPDSLRLPMARRSPRSGVSAGRRPADRCVLRLPTSEPGTWGTGPRVQFLCLVLGHAAIADDILGQRFSPIRVDDATNKVCL